MPTTRTSTAGAAAWGWARACPGGARRSRAASPDGSTRQGIPTSACGPRCFVFRQAEAEAFVVSRQNRHRRDGGQIEEQVPRDVGRAREERGGVGDEEEVRRVDQPFVPTRPPEAERGRGFLPIHRGRRCVCVDLGNPNGRVTSNDQSARQPFKRLLECTVCPFASSSIARPTDPRPPA